MKVLIIGGAGQDAFYLTQYIASKGSHVYWVYRNSIKRFKNQIPSKDVSLIRVADYTLESILPKIKGILFDAIVLIVSTVGNAAAVSSPFDTYRSNILLADIGARLAVAMNPSPHLYYFSTTDIDGRTSMKAPIRFETHAAELPSSTYGLSKLHSSQYLMFLRDKQILNSTVIFLSMHESCYRQGDYVLSKVKAMATTSLLGNRVCPTTFGNLDVYLDIGYAPDFMAIVGEVVLCEIKAKEVRIGTGVYTHLLTLCRNILYKCNVDPDIYMQINGHQQFCTYYPLVSCSLGDQRTENDAEELERLLPPPPLDPDVLALDMKIKAEWHPRSH